MKETERENVASLIPIVTEFEKPFWDGLKNQTLFIQKCKVCGNIQFPPSPVCTQCLSDKVEWKECSGKATLWSKVVFHKSYLEPYPDVPYTVALGKLEEGPMVTGRLPEEYADKVQLDDPLKVGFSVTKDGTVLVTFSPAERK